MASSSMDDIAREIASAEKLVSGISFLRDQFFKEASLKVRDRAAANHKFTSRTGRLENAIRVEMNADEMSLYLDEDMASYARYIHDGVSPHIIKPSQSKALVFDSMFARVVHHPGIEADPFLHDAVDDTQIALFEMFESQLDEVLRGVM